MNKKPTCDNAGGEPGEVGKTEKNQQLKYNVPSDLIPESFPPVVPTYWHATGTRAYEALQAIIAEPQNQADDWHGWRLAAYVPESTELGWVFVKRDIFKPGCSRPISEYSIDRTASGTAVSLASHQKGFVSSRLLENILFAVMVAVLVVMVRPW